MDTIASAVNAESLDCYDRYEPVRQAQDKRLELRNIVAAGFVKLVEQGRWQHAVRLVVVEAGVTEAELARHLEAPRSTVNRWMNGRTAPLPSAVPYLAEQVVELLRT